jgi:hypothetical protein
VNLFLNKIKLKFNGDLHFKSILNHRNFDLSLSAKELSCTLALRGSIISTAIQLARGSTSSAHTQLLSGVSVEMSDLSLINKMTNKTLLYTEDWNLKTNFTQSSDGLELYHSSNATNTEFYPEFNALTDAVLQFQNVRGALEKLNTNVRNYFAVFSPDKFGKINYEADILFESDANSLRIYKFKLQDALQTIDLSGKLSFAEKTKIDATFSGNFSPQWYSLAQVYANRFNMKYFPHTAFKKSDSIFATIFNGITGFVRESFESKGNRAAYVPKLHEMGQLKVRAILTHSKLPGGFQTAIDTFDISAQNIGLDLRGSINSPTHGGDTYSLKAHLHNYPLIVGYAVGYLNRITSSMNYAFFISGKELHLSPSVQRAIQLFIHKLSDNSSSQSSDLSLTIVNKDGGLYPSVGPYSSKTFARMWNNFIWKVILGEITRSALNPENLAKMLMSSPAELQNTLSQNMATGAQKLAEGVMNIFGINS